MENKIRVWDLLNKLWVTEKNGYNYIFDALSARWFHVENCEYKPLNFSSELVINKPTGLQDKHGVFMYEGDYVADADFVYEIRFGEYTYQDMELVGFYFFNELGNGIIGKCDESVLEIIGNIYENPDLAK